MKSTVFLSCLFLLVGCGTVRTSRDTVPFGLDIESAEDIKRKIAHMHVLETGADRQESLDPSDAVFSSYRLLLILDRHPSSYSDKVLLDLYSYDLGTYFNELLGCVVQRRGSQIVGRLEELLASSKKSDCVEEKLEGVGCVSRDSY